jgi:hypothetical protein
MCQEDTRRDWKFRHFKQMCSRWYPAGRREMPNHETLNLLVVGSSPIVPREVVYESVFSGSVGLAQLTTADSRVV